jgi:hypothetical protein
MRIPRLLFFLPLISACFAAQTVRIPANRLHGCYCPPPIVMPAVTCSPDKGPVSRPMPAPIFPKPFRDVDSILGNIETACITPAPKFRVQDLAMADGFRVLLGDLTRGGTIMIFGCSCPSRVLK